MRSLKSKIAAIIKSMIYRSGLDRLKRRFLPATAPVIIRYHSVCSQNLLISPGILISPEAFTEQVTYFSKYFQVITMDDLIDAIKKKTPFPKNALVFTFDDGYADNLEAAKILKKYELTGLFYITAGCIETDEAFWVAEVRHLIENTNKKEMTLPFPDGESSLSLSNKSDRELTIKKMTRLFKSVTIETRESLRKAFRIALNDTPAFPSNLMLNWSQLQEMVEMGMEIGGHTMTHPNLPSATKEEAREEICSCKSLLEKQLKTPVNHFAYPNGGSVAHFDDKTKAILQEAGFHSATTSKAGRPGFKSDLFEIRRMRATENLSEMLWDF